MGKIMEDQKYFMSEYKSEKEKTEVLERKLTEATNEMNATQARLDRIKGSKLWELSKPARDVIHFLQRTKQRITRYGSIKGILRKINSKRLERAARASHGTLSFPDADRRRMEEETVFDRDIVFSILVPLYNTPKKFLKDMIESVTSQTYAGWELCLADGSDDEHGYVGQMCLEYADRDSRIKYKKLEKNEGISGNTNQCYAMATGNFIALFDHDDILHPSVLYEYMKVICEQDADYIYCDETTFKGNKSIDDMITLHFKPDFSIDNLRANNYICHFSAFDRNLLEGMELFRSRFDGSQDHDMILRLTSRAKNVVHVPRLMYYWRSHKASVAANINAKSYAIDAAKGAVAAHLSSCGFENFEITSTKAFETIFRIRYELTGNPKVSIVIPNKDHADDLRRCVSSIMEKSTYDNYEIVIVNNNSATDEIFAYYDELKSHANIKIVNWEGELSDGTKEEAAFNYSAICNFGVRASSGEYVLLLNNDTEVITLDWIEELLMYAQRKDVACVGGKLFYPDKTIQHAGVVIGLGAHRTAGHTHYMMPQENLGYMGRLCYAQDATAVTGACLLVSRAIYDEVGGLDETFKVSLNDVDFCLKCREKGYLNVWTPFAELFHYESISRGSDMNGASAKRYDEESARFREKWAAKLEAGDPYYNPNFSLDRSDYTIMPAKPRG